MTRLFANISLQISRVVILYGLLVLLDKTILPDNISFRLAQKVPLRLLFKPAKLTLRDGFAGSRICGTVPTFALIEMKDGGKNPIAAIGVPEAMPAE